MSSQFKRTDRVAGIIQRKLAQILPKEIRDPRLKGFVTVSAVKVAADLGHAKVYFTVLDEEKKQALTILNAAAGHLRSVLARSMTSRTVPQLHFIYDESIEYARHLTRVIDEANASDVDDHESP